MRIKNEYVEIKIGNKVYTKQNMILNTYLKAIFEAQIYTEHNNSNIGFCYLKLDTPLENVDYDSQINATDFDIQLFGKEKSSIITTESLIKVIYNFNDTSFFFKKSDGTWAGTAGGNLNMFVGRKVVGIGFGINRKCFAYLDTNNMNIIINENEQFRITRVDNFLSDGIVKNLDYPLHLINDIAKKDLKYVYINNIGYEESTMAQLYSVGFGNTAGYMEEEYLIDDVETDRDDYSITLNVSRIKKIGHYPSEDLQLGFYPTMDNSKYLIFKYRLYRRYTDSNSQFVVTYLDKYYTMSKPNENFGNLDIKLKIERS